MKPMKHLLGLLSIVLLSFYGSSQSGQHLQLNGTDAYMTVPDHSDLDIDAGENYTITAQVKGSSFAAYNRILHKRISGNGTGYQFINNVANGELGINLKAANGANAGPPFGSTPILDGNWHHVAMVVDISASSCKIYVDGVLEQTNVTSAIGPQSFQNGVDLFIGLDPDALQYFQGSLDDIRFWSTDMTTAQINADITAIVNGTEPNLISAWDFENVTGSTVYDSGFNGHDGTLFGGALINNPSGPLTYSSTSLNGTNLPTGRGNHDQRVLQLNIQTTGTTGTLDLTNIEMSIGGTTAADIDSIKVYYGGSDLMLNTLTPFGGANVSGGTINITGNQSLLPGNNYLWITYDIDDNATEGNTIEATCSGVTVGPSHTIAPSTTGDQRVILLEHNTLFSGGDYSSNSYRIPAICTAHDGTLITAVDARVNNNTDLPGDIDISVRRSLDNGKTWLAPQIVADFGSNGASDPALVVDRSTGDIIMMFASHNGLMASTPSNKIRFQVCRSTDNGVTWSAPIEHSSSIYAPGWYAAWVASGSAHQLRSGRIVAIVGARTSSGSAIRNYMIYSDDGGFTWDYNPNQVAFDGNESKIIELDNGDLMVNSRNSTTNRKVVTSSNGGASWSGPVADLIDPRCNGDLIRYTSTLDGFAQSRVLFSNLQHTSSRKNLHVYLSYDEASTWAYSKQIYADASAYSSLTVLDDGSIGVYYENGEYENYQMSFARFSLDWLTNGNDQYILPEIDIAGNGNSIIDGATTSSINDDTYFGVTCGSSSLTQTFTVTNVNTGAPLLVTNINSSNPEFTVTSIANDTLSGSSSSTFDITYTPTGSTLQTSTITVSNNDSDESSFTFVVEGITNTYSNTLTLTECPGFSITIGTNTYNSTGIYTDVLTASNGCDSTITTDLTIYTPINHNQTLTECAGFSITIGTNTYNSTGIYTDVLIASNGCDSTVTTDLTILLALDNSTTLNGNVISSNATGVQYQWIDCNNNNAPINGETSNTFEPSINGDYAVIISDGTCSDTSACVNISSLGLDEFGSNVLTLYPNPVENNTFTINTDQAIENIVLADDLGRILQVSIDSEFGVVNTGDISPGRYTVIITTSERTFTREIIIVK